MRLGRGLLLWLGFVIATACAAGCASIGPANRASDTPTLPRKKEIRVGQYLFLADVDLKADDPLLKKLEGLQEQISKELYLPPSPSLVKVYVFADRERFERYIHANFKDLPPRRAFFMARRDERLGDDLCVYTYWGDRIQEDLRHELTHASLHSVIRDVPLWLDEGLAEYFETPPEWNGVNHRHLAEFRNPGNPPWTSNLSRLERLTDVKEMSAADYRESWLWVHWMLRSTPENKEMLLDYLYELRTGRRPGPLEPRLIARHGDPAAAVQSHLQRLEAESKILGAKPR